METVNEENKLSKAQHDLLYAAFDAFSLPGAVCDKDGNMALANKHMLANISTNTEKILNTPVAQWFITEPPLETRQIQALFADPNTNDCHVPCHVNGKPYMLTLTAIRSDDAITGFAMVLKETSVTKLKNQALKHDIKDYAFLCIDLNEHITAWNEGAHFIFGYKEKEALQLSREKFYSAADIEKGHPASLLKEAKSHGRADDEGIRLRKDGSKFWASEITTPIRDPFGVPCGYMIIVRDITEQKLHMEILERELHSYQTILANFPNGVVKIFDHQLNYTLVKGQGMGIMDSSIGEPTGKPIQQLYPDHIWKQLEGPFKRALEGEPSSFEMQVHDKYLLLNTMPVKGRKGEIHNGILIAQDLSAIKKADIEVAKYNNLLRAVFEGTSDVVFVKDLKGQYLMANPAGAAYFGKTSDQIIGLTNYDLFSKEDADITVRMDDSLIKDKHIVTYEETVMIRGKKLTFNTTKGPLFDHEGKLIGLVGISRDVTETKKTEKKLKKAEVGLNDAQELAGICSFEYIVKDALRIWSGNTNKLLGLAADTLLEDGIRYLVIEEDLPLIDSAWQHAMEEKKPFGLEFRLRKPDGKVIYLQGVNKPVLNKKGKVVKVRGTLQDITQRKLAELSISQMNETLEKRVQERTEALQKANAALSEKEEYFRSLIQNSSDVVQLVGADRLITFVSASVYKILGYTPAEMLGKRGLEFVHPDDAEKSYTIFRKLLENPSEPATMVHRIKHKNGSWLWIETTGNNLLDNPAIQAVVINYHDVTERVLAQEAMQAMNESLEERVKERTSQLQAANKELEAFSYSVSHDLRAPLRAVVGFGQVLERDHMPELGEEGKRILNIIMHNSERMGHLIDDLLEFSRLGRREQKIYQFGLSKLVNDLIIEQFPNAEQKAKIIVDELPDITADRAMISQVYVNLISNAIKFSKSHETNHIKIGCRLEKHEKVFYISDEGVGFDMRYKDKLFGVFQRLHSAKDFEGTGVGLALVQRIIQRHGGIVWADSKVNGGATFYFTLPQNHAG